MLWAQNQIIAKKTIKQILTFGGKITNFNLSAKILKGVNHLWTQLLLVQKCHNPKHWKRTLQHVKENCENSTYHKTQSQTIKHQKRTLQCVKEKREKIT